MTALIRLASNNEVRLDRRMAFRNVLNENREMITRPALTLIPSLFSLFSLPFLIISFSVGCQNVDEDPVRYVLIVFYFVTYVPPMLMFILYISPSSFYCKEWESTAIRQWMTALRHRPSVKRDTNLSVTNGPKTRDLSPIPKRDWKESPSTLLFFLQS